MATFCCSLRPVEPNSEASMGRQLIGDSTYTGHDRKKNDASFRHARAPTSIGKPIFAGISSSMAHHSAIFYLCLPRCGHRHLAGSDLCPHRRATIVSCRRCQAKLFHATATKIALKSSTFK
ncbi:hypothetical protein E2562_024575 [Oryza meyeriana var. granulata]|uniref:Uncharacterized protein n=1 Tax=Oryza meyeriana var. granulata TaxID=110450 RepID=A0A6G1CSP9_9ORYZ|nr:hypothetical protein E2562_024575 [Oryza meyeriana var. granulata]